MMTRFTFFRLSSTGTLVLALSACSGGSQHIDLQNYVTEVKSQPKGEIDPLPPVRTYEAYVYQAASLRSPFEKPIEAAVVSRGPVDPNTKPDPTRPKEFLESFSLETLTMVGMLKQNGELWALIKEPQGGIQRVTVGNYMGKNHGRIERATDTAIDLVEIVSDGLGGWVKRPKTIKLSEKE